MGAPFTLQQAFAGIDRDNSRDMARPNTAYNLQDYIPYRIGAPLRKRGGWGYSGALGSSTFVDALAHVPFPSGASLCAIGGDANLYVGGSSIGATVAAAQNPVWFNQALVMYARDGATTGKTYDASGGLLALGGTPPPTIYGCAFKGRLYGANTAAHPNYLYVAPAGWGPSGAGGSWDTTNGFVPTLSAVNGVAPSAAAVLIFHDKSVERLRGTIPPGTTNSDMILEPLFQGMGCVDARSITSFNGNVIWADQLGIYETDGAAPRDLTSQVGLKQLWQQSMAGFTKPTSSSNGWRCAAGMYGDFLLMSITNAGAFVDAYCIDMSNLIGYRFQNFPFRSFAASSGSGNEIYMAHANVGQVALGAGMWSPTAANKLDGDGSPVLPSFESTYWRGWTHWHRKWVPSQGLQTWRFLYADYQLVDAAADLPTLAVSLAKTPEATTYATTLTSAPATAAGTLGRTRHPLNFPAPGVAIKVAQTAASADTRIYAFEAEYGPREGSRLQ